MTIRKRSRYVIGFLVVFLLIFQGIWPAFSSTLAQTQIAYAAAPSAHHDSFFNYSNDPDGVRLTMGTDSGFGGSNTWNYPQAPNGSINDKNPVELDNEGYIINTDGPDEVAYIKKSATEDSSKQGLFNMTLDIKGNSIEHPIDVVFVLDYSSTMKGEKLDNAIKGVKQFLDTVQDQVNAGLIRVGAVAYNSPKYPAATTGGFVGSADMVDFLENVAESHTGTFVQKGLYAGQKIFQDNPKPDAEKLMIHIGDGEANCSYLPTNNERPFTNQGEIIPLNGYSATSYATSFQTNNPQYNTSMTITDTNAILNQSKTMISNDTIGTAIAIRNDIEIFSIGATSSGRGEYTARNLASSASHYVTIDEDLKGLSEALGSLAAQVDSTISHGTATDPMGDGVILQKQGSTFGPNDYTLEGYRKNPSDQWEDAPDLVSGVTVVENDNTLQMLNLNLGKDEKVVFTYNVRLETEAIDFEPDAWYLANKETTLDPQSNGSNLFNFPIPSIKAPLVELQLEKIWEGDEAVTITGGGGTFAENLDYSGNRVDPILIVLERKTVTSSTGWSLTEPIALSDAENWMRNVSEVEPRGESTPVKLPLYNNQGDAFTYEAFEVEGTQNGGYRPSSNWDGSANPPKLTITNTLQTTDIGFTKYGVNENGVNEPLEGAEFTLSGEDSKGTSFSITATSDNSGQVSFSGLPVGNYTLQETSVPSGYLGWGSAFMLDLEVYMGADDELHTTVKYGDSEWAWEDLNKEVFNVQDNSRQGNFPFVKHRETGMDESEPLSGVEFSLTNLVGGNTVNNVTSIVPNGLVNFEDVQTGIYVLKEESGWPPEIKPADPLIVLVYWDNGSPSQLHVRYLSLGGKLLGKDTEGFPIVVNKQQTDFKFTKVDEDGVPFGAGEAEFELHFGTVDGTPVLGPEATDANGVVAFENLGQGTYWLVETKTPDGYQTMEPLEVQVGFDGQGNIAILTPTGYIPDGDYQVTNTPLPPVTTDITLTKKDDFGRLLSNIQFELRDEDGTPVASATSDQNGTIYFSDVSAGTYYLVEIDSPNNLAELDAFPIVVSSNDDGTLSVTVQGNPYSPGATVLNMQIAAGFTFSKADFEGNLLAGAVFEVRDVSGKVMESATSDSKGVVTFHGLPKGNYEMFEAKAPAGYQPIDGSIGIEVSYNDDGELVTKFDFRGHDNLFNGTVYNELDTDLRATVSLKKEGKGFWGQTPLEGVTFRLSGFYTGKPTYEATSNGNGIVDFKEVKVGYYVLEETETPEGYTPIDPVLVQVYIDTKGEMHIDYPGGTFAFDENDRPIIVNMHTGKDDPASDPGLPDTGDHTKVWLWVLLGVASLCAMLAVGGGRVAQARTKKIKQGKHL